jgi:DNA-binding Lrp family transcriptional regulator
MAMTKGQDILVLLKLVAQSGKKLSYMQLAASLGMSPSEVHAAMGRLEQAGFLNAEERIPNRQAVREFLVHGLRYVFPMERKGGLCRGIPTAQGAPMVESAFDLKGEPTPVWPDATGKVRGLGVLPIYSAAPKASIHDPELYRLLVYCDLLRGGQARERAWAEQQLDKTLNKEQA